MYALVPGLMWMLGGRFVTSISFAAVLSTARFNQYAGRVRTLVPMGLALGELIVLTYYGTRRWIVTGRVAQ